ncbi:SulP family inorganic anion transporter [Aeromicrobium sp. IC_218]|uniref:SulP family inorganic anion transporter n=1 Tax=Aeromicrobium sp. IC_218 TaxID=2545468 RepID=UPI0010389462|nr:SulP family inorganic anion transporter [Aeromicrobium sp. IC_218]TCI97624.1 sulfate transporter [Aeromicrobium sp. IC_218]
MPGRAVPAWIAPTWRRYRRAWLRVDVLAGLAAGTVVVPQAMAYATIAGLPVQVGLYTCMVPMVVYALLGGGRAVSVSTTSTIAVLVAATLAGLPAAERGDADALLGAAFTLTFLAGLCLVAMRLLRLSALVECISPATLTGIRIGVGLTVAASQLPNLLGVPADPDAGGFFEKTADALGRVPDADGTTVAVSVGAVVLLLVLRRVVPQVPGPLVVVAGGIALVALTDVEERGLALVDHVPTGLPSLSVPVAGDVLDLLPGALAVAFMAFLETVLVARTNRRRDEPPIDSEQELVATGLAALAGGLTQTLPPAGGFSQSAVNLRSGARTQVAQLVTATLAVLVALVLAPLLDELPRAVLAAMVLVAILGLLRPSELRLYAQVDRAELWVALVVAGLGLTGGMLLGVAVGVALTLVLVVRAVNQPRVQPAAPSRDGVLRLRLLGGVYTGNATATHDEVLRLVAACATAPREVRLDAEAVSRVTVPFLDLLRSLTDELGDVRLGLERVPEDLVLVLRRTDWWRAHESDLLVPDGTSR